LNPNYAKEVGHTLLECYHDYLCSQGYRYAHSHSPEEFTKAKEAQEQKLEMHHYRMSPYLLLTKPKPITAESWPEIDWGMIRLIRVMSSVSADFRRDLAAIFWTRVHLDVAAACIGDLITFIQDRSAALKSIKSMKIHFHEEYTRIQLDRLPELFDILSSNLELEELTVFISATKLDLRKINSGGWNYLGRLSGLNSLKVTRRFEVDLGEPMTFDDNLYGMYGGGWEEDPLRSEKLARKYTPIIKRLITPNCLRGAEDIDGKGRENDIGGSDDQKTILQEITKEKMKDSPKSFI